MNSVPPLPELSFAEVPATSRHRYVGNRFSYMESGQSDAASVLRRRMVELSVGIERMREHQRAIARLLKGAGKLSKEKDMVTKQKWTAIMSAAGFSEEDMRRWHREFEKSAPAEHQEFLEFLHIPPDEIKTIRAWSAS